MTDAPRPVSPGDLGVFIEAVFRHHGLSASHAASVAHAMILADLRGVDTHGVVRTGGYVERFKHDLVAVAPQIECVTRYGWAHAIDGGNGMGPVVADFAMQKVLESAGTFGIGGATVRRSNHFGAAQVYALQAVQAGCVAMVFSPASRALAPFGSMEPLLGTNPVAVAAPAGRHAPWSLDMATSIAARGHVRLAARRGDPIPEGWALDAQGRPTTDAAAALKGVMLPFSGPKGSALAMMVEVLGGVLSGSAYAGDIRDMTQDFTAPQDAGHFFLAFKVDAFMPLADYTQRMEHMIARLKALKPAAGFTEVFYPGEREARLAAERTAQGIPIRPEVLAVLAKLSQETGIALPDALA